MLKPFIAKLMHREDLSAEEAEQAMQIIMSGQATDAQIGGYLIALRMKGETVDEITGSARAMRAQAGKVPYDVDGDPLLDTCGTGGDGAHTFNISTTAAFVIAGAGRKVAKHGNRAASSRCGSADVLNALGVNLDLTPEQVAACIEQVGIGFIFAPRFHPAMKYAIGPRRELGQRTIFNLLGPLTNPAGATHQLIGVYDPALTQPLAEVLGSLGGQAAFVVHGYGGLDELTTSGPNRVSHLSDGKVTTYELDALTLGLRPAAADDLRGGDPAENAVMMRALLSGQDRTPRRDVVLLNSAAALATETGDFPSALVEARAALESGAAWKSWIPWWPSARKLRKRQARYNDSRMNILDEIFAYKREEVAARMRACSLAQVQRDAEEAAPAAGFYRRAAYMARRPALIAEVKRASPSRGLLVQDFDPLRLARIYQENGAAAISVLTDERYFQGHLDYLRQIARISPRLPLLRKDFTCDPYQVYEARAAGADAMLLIAAYLDPASLRDLHALIRELGMAALVEVHTASRAGRRSTSAARPGGDQ